MAENEKLDCNNNQLYLTRVTHNSISTDELYKYMLPAYNFFNHFSQFHLCNQEPITGVINFQCYSSISHCMDIIFWGESSC